MDLRERLRLLKVAGAERAAAQAAQPAHQAAQPAHQAAQPAHQAAQPAHQAAQPGASPAGTHAGTPAVAGGCLQGYLTATDAGEAFYLEARYPLSHSRGPLPLASLFTVPGDAWELLSRVSPGLDLRRACFLDTETTGLAGGTGTYAFLIGLGYFDGDEFVVKQYFLRDYPEEDALLAGLAADLARFDLLVSFNGKSYDWPLIETRYRMARRRPPLSGAPHIDLLHPARRLYKMRLGACNLTNLESQVLGVQREGDVAGHLIPPLYFDYLRTGDAGQLAGVIEHNRLDIVSLVALAAWLGWLVTDPLSPTPDGELVPGDDLFALARLFEARGRQEAALAAYVAAADRGASTLGQALLDRELARAYKRLGRHDEALSVWERMAQETSGHTLHALVEMAKYYEHVARDYTSALVAAERAMAMAQRRLTLASTLGARARQEYEELEHRLNRLNRKAGLS